MYGGFACSKNSLAFLNVLFLLVSFLLIGIASYAKAAAIVTSFEIAGGVIASGLFLFLIAFLGLIAGTKHHQVLLFFYIIILFLLFIIQFSVSIACLAVSERQVTKTIAIVWPRLQGNATSPGPKHDVEIYFGCCEWDESYWVNDTKTDCIQANICDKIPDDTTPEPDEDYNCTPCNDVVPKQVSSLLEATGGIGLFFSFTEMLGVWLAVRFRNQKDPSANPSQFL